MAHARPLQELARPTRQTLPRDAAPTDIVTNLCAALFAGFRGYDQRVRARQYMEGLLRAEGRKTIANIAASVGVPGDEQRLHHFVNSSRWEVSPVRRALAAYLGGNDPASAWVTLSVSIPKAGRRMVGVSPHFSAGDGHRVFGQQAHGVWYASERLVAPVSWRIGLPGPSAAQQPPGGPGAPAARSTAQDCVSDLLDDIGSWQATPRLLVTDARGDDEQARLAMLLEKPGPVAVRISGRTVLAVGEHRRGAGREERLTAAHSALDPARRTRRGSRSPHGQGAPATATATVRLPGPRGTGRPGPTERLALLGVWDAPRCGVSELWLTNVDDPSSTALLRATRLVRRIHAGWNARGQDVGLRDYEGRSFQGWHRHMTLASCAYAMAELRSSGASGGSSLAA